MAVVVTLFAALQYQQTIAPKLTVAEAREEIMSYRRGLDAAVENGCRVVQIAHRAKIILDRNFVVRVLPPKSRRTAGHGAHR